ncbi:hypothetical protein K2173_006866 [Erythroxylum novogranatense]|uniref:Myb-like domain-containing protein n=1 Tax=Erythroxylum novogranatense TaxID=1862640 RepID=A0AAV8SYX9_9ROSI|nr:hypothetical protein K2173_006866 [Erythroxylum novogranatense]
MALEHDNQQLSLSTNAVDGGSANGVGARLNAADGGDDGRKAPRLPRWTRQEILVLIQGKRVAENRVRRGRAAGMGLSSGHVEPKWATVSSYCKRHGVNRGPVQCRKRWSNLAGDYKKIKEWESQMREERESFWVMRNDLRRERKLPGFFDREVYDILDGTGGVSAAASLAQANETEAVFDGGRSAAVEDGVLLSDFDEDGGGSSEKETAAKDVQPIRAVAAVDTESPLPISERQYQQSFRFSQHQDTADDNQRGPDPEMGSPSHEGRKRKRFEDEEEPVSLHDRLIDVVDRNCRMLNAQLEAQNINIRLDREQRKNQADGMLAVLNKLADALGKIADKL